MFKNYLKIALRNLYKYKGYSFINIVGLTAGLTCSMLILMWVQHELSYDRFNKHAEDVYRVVENQFYAGGEIFPVAVTPGPLASALKTEFPEIVQATRFNYRTLTIKKDEQVFSEGVAFADPEFFDIFTLPLVQGNLSTALSDPHSLVLTQEAAAKYFGDGDAVGQVLRINNQVDFRVTAVIENVPDNSHLQFDILAPFVYMREMGSNLVTWRSNWCYTYVRLQKNTPHPQVDEKIVDLIKKNNENSVTEIYLQPLTEIHLYSSGKYTADIGGHGDIQYVKIFSVIALFVLLIACINFMNLATARSERRAKEVGLRKVVGARRSQLINQFFGEAVFLSLIAFIAALILVKLLQPTFNDLSGKTLGLGTLEPYLFLSFLAIALLTGIISGIYPSLFLSSFKPIETLKGGGSARRGGSLFRKTLVVLQFALSVIMIIGTLVVIRQMEFIRNKNLGLNKENLGYVWMSGQFREKSAVAKQELLRNPNITAITRTSQLPTYVARSSSGFGWPGKDPNDDVLMHLLSVDEDYVNAFAMEMAEGRFFSREFPADSQTVVINQRAAEIMGLENPVGQPLTAGQADYTIVGVVKDFHFKPVRTKIEPLLLFLSPTRYYAMVMRTRPENISETIEFVERTYKNFNPDTPFFFNFLDEDYDRLYRAEQRAGKLSGYFAAIAILIASLGLYGLASYMAERRTKEIGVRKVLGASIPNLFLLLSKNFIVLAGIANLIAWPIAWFVMSGWLENYAYRTNLNAFVFIAAAALAVVIVLITVSYQAVRAARANPIDSLRYE